MKLIELTKKFMMISNLRLTFLLWSATIVILKSVLLAIQIAAIGNKTPNNTDFKFKKS